MDICFSLIYLSCYVRNCTFNTCTEWWFRSACTFAQSNRNVHWTHFWKTKMQSFLTRTTKMWMRRLIWVSFACQKMFSNFAHLSLYCNVQEKNPYHICGQWNTLCMQTCRLIMALCLFQCTCVCNATSDWITKKICDSIFCNILSKIRCHHVISLVIDWHWFYAANGTCRFVQICTAFFFNKTNE